MPRTVHVLRVQTRNLTDLVKYAKVPRVMEIVNKTTLNTLAAVGFVAVLFAGMALAVYVARYVPVAVNGLGAAAVSLTELFIPSTTGDVTVVENTPTLNIGPEDTTLPPPATENESVKEESDSSTSGSTAIVTPGSETTSTTEITGGGQVNAGTVLPNGRPDLVPSILAVGLMTGTSTASFQPATTTLKADQRIGVKFVIQNKGSGATGEWRFTAVLPTEPSYVYTSPAQQSLLPGERIEYVIGYDRSKWGNDLQISVTADHSNQVNESVEDNNSAFFKLNVLRP